MPIIPPFSRLASQHHCSDYSRAKFGPNGSPVEYIPLSLQHPDHYAQLCVRQQMSAHIKHWWPAPTPADAGSPSLQDEIMDAMSQPLQRSSQAQLKTSHTHPINISCIIPPDLVGPMSSHALLGEPIWAPTILELPPGLTLNHLSSLRDKNIPATPPLQPYSHAKSSIVDALQAAITSVTEFSPIPEISVSLSTSIPALPGGDQPSPKGLRTIPPRPLYSQLMSPSLRKSSSNLSVLNSAPPTIRLYTSQSLNLSLPSQTPRNITLQNIDSSQNVITHPPVPNLFLPKNNPIKPISSFFTIGNLFLSSCPGKKVRLDGPVKGRSSVCRDVETDMRRMKELGVGCIVCCLDDAELDFLGAPWPEYESCASKLGLDILRIPIPEGLPPLSAPSLDVHLTDLISRYTLRGTSVLVHCRGGVGRAGVVACCWMIRLGLCGWPAEGDHISFVEKVISLVRRRRSIKALETYEQVQFLVDYVEYLRNTQMYEDSRPLCM